MDRLNLPKKIYFKSGGLPVALREITEVYGMSRALVVTSPALFLNGSVAKVNKCLAAQKVRTAEFFSISEPASIAEVKSGLPKALEFKPDVIIGVGGGAVMSAAKALWALYENPDLDLAEAAKKPELIVTGAKAQLILVATSFGSGCQNSPFAVLSDCTLNSFQLLPLISATDADFTATMTAEQVKACGLATLARAIRSYADPGCNEYTQGLLREAIMVTLKQLPAAVNGCTKAKESLHNAASIAGAAYGCVSAAFDADPVPYPAASDKASDRITQLAKEVGYADAKAFNAACKALQ